MSKRKIYIECGITLRTKVNTGIQRVVRNIISEAIKISPQIGCEIVLVAYKNNGFYFPNESHDEGRALYLIRRVGFYMRELVPVLNRTGIFIRINRRVGSWIKYIIYRKSKAIKLESIGADGQPAVLLLLDSNWDDKIWPEIDTFRNNGGVACAVLYDLIPFTHPETVEDQTLMAHTAWWSKAPLHVNSVMCISQAVRDEFVSWQRKMKFRSPLTDKQISYFYLGADLSSNDPVIKLISDGEPYFLMVGSLEPRKNHNIVLDAFDQVWHQGGASRLVIVGAHGWKSEALLSRIEGHSLLNEKLFLVRDASDRDLAALYSKAMALIIASKAEGFGLPIVEAAQHGVPIICSDIPVFREVADDQLASFFNPVNAESLAKLIQGHEKEKKYNKRFAKSPGWITWQESAEQLLRNVIKLAIQNKDG